MTISLFNDFIIDTKVSVSSYCNIPNHQAYWNIYVKKRRGLLAAFSVKNTPLAGHPAKGVYINFYDVANRPHLFTLF